MNILLAIVIGALVGHYVVMTTRYLHWRTEYYRAITHEVSRPLGIPGMEEENA